MKLYKILAVVAGALVLTSCGEKFLTAHTTHQGAAGAEATESAILSYLTATYQPLLMDSYANYNYNHILLLSDLRSDDIYKGGGDAGDQSWMYHLSLFQIPAAESPSGIWSLYYTAIARANNTLLAIDNAVGFDSDAAKRKLAQYRAEALFLRAYYLHHCGSSTATFLSSPSRLRIPSWLRRRPPTRSTPASCRTSRTPRRRPPRRVTSSR